MDTNLLGTLNYFFFESCLNEDIAFKNYPLLKQTLKQGKFDEFLVDIVRELKVNQHSVINDNNFKKELERFEHGIKEFENSIFFKQLEALHGTNPLLANCNWKKMFWIANQFLIELRKMQAEQLNELDRVLLEISKSENQFWKGLPMEIVLDHFIVYTKRLNKNGVTYLSKEQLVSFLKRGFLNDTKQPKQKFNCDTGEKGLVILRFYEFYNLCAAKYGHPNKKEKFIKLFTNCFDNWNKKTIEFFFKPNKTKDKW